MRTFQPFGYAESLITGHLVITDLLTNEILVDKDNSIHFENFSEALAYSFAHQGHNINLMAFGNGGSTVSGTGAVTYFPPNVTGSDAQLYHQTYSKVVDDNSPLNGDATRNKLQVRHLANRGYSDIIVICTLDYNEPAGQAAFDDATDQEGDFIFDELGLKAFDATPENGKLLTHVVFNPVQKSLNRIIEISYTLRLAMA